MARAFDQTETDRRLANMASYGVVSEIDPETGRARIQIGELLTGWLPVMATRAGGDRTWAMVEAGEQVAVLAPSGDFANALILGGMYSGAHPAPADSENVTRMEFADGAVVEYDRAAHRLSALLPAGGEVDIDAPGGVTINGDVVVTGDVIADGVSLVRHTHHGVTPGGGDTGEPNQ